MPDYNIDNSGTGFSLDDEEDLNSMFTEAANASSDSGDDSILHSMGNYLEQEPEAKPARRRAKKAEPTPAPVVEKAPEPEAIDFESLANDLDALEFDFPDEPSAEEPAVIEEPAPVVAEQPIVVEELAPIIEPEPTPEPATEPVAPPAPPAGAVRVPREADQLRDAERIIKILDAYRRLNSDEKSVATQFVTGGEHDRLSDHALVVKVINCDHLLTTTMRALREAYECDQVERAFYVIGLDDTVLHHLGPLVQVFTNTTFDASSPRIAYPRALVAAISSLGDRDISFVKATESVLSAAEMS